MNIFEIINQSSKLVSIISIALIILPIIFLFLKQDLLFGLYAVSIVSNIPAIIMLRFSFSYELFLGLLIILSILKEYYFNKNISFNITKQSLILGLLLVVIFLVNIVMSFANFNKQAVGKVVYLFFTNLFVLGIFCYYLINERKRNVIIRAVLIGGLLLAVSTIFEMFYNYYHLSITNGRYGGLLIDQNATAFALNICFLLSFLKVRIYNGFNIIIRLILRILFFFAIIITCSRSGAIILLASSLLLIAMHLKGRRDTFKLFAFTLVMALLVILFKETLATVIGELSKMIDFNRVIDVFHLPFSLDKGAAPSGGPGLAPPPIEMDQASSGRIQLFLNSLSAIRHNWLLGVGIGNVPATIDPTNLMNSHNLWLQLILESGFLMAFALLGFSIYLLIYLFNRKFKNKTIFIFLFVLIFIESFFNHNLFNMNLIWLCIALLFATHLFSSKTYYSLQLTNKLLFENKERLTYEELINSEHEVKFTIITPTYNRAHLLERLYNSLTLQTNQDFEWIIVNDGSTDITKIIVERFINEGKLNIKYLTQDNLGKHNAIAHGLEYAQGKFLFIVDSDDYLAHDCLEYLQKWFYNKDLQNYFIAGVAGVKSDLRFKTKRSFPLLTSSLIANNIERERLKLQHDKAECFFTDLLKQYDFARNNNEKFLTERIIWDQMAHDGYNIFWNDQQIYVSEYQDDGLTAQSSKLYLDNLIGYSEFIKSLLIYDFPSFFRARQVGAYTHLLIKNYGYSYADISALSGFRPLELFILYNLYNIFKKQKVGD